MYTIQEKDHAPFCAEGIVVGLLAYILVNTVFIHVQLSNPNINLQCMRRIYLSIYIYIYIYVCVLV